MQITSRFKNWSSIGNKRADLALNHKGFDSGIISKKITRKISAPIAKFLYNQNKNINPNHLTLISTGIGLGAAVVFYLSEGNPLYAISGGLLIQLSYIIDEVDGDYARYLSESQRSAVQKSFGEYLDTVTDRIVDIAIIYGMGIYLSNVFPESWWVLPLTFATMSFSLIASYTRHQIIKIYSKYRNMKYYIPSGVNFATRDVRLFMFFLGGLSEGLSYISPIPRGFFLALSMIVVFFFHLVKLINSFFELKRNLNNLRNIEVIGKNKERKSDR